MQMLEMLLCEEMDKKNKYREIGFFINEGLHYYPALLMAHPAGSPLPYSTSCMSLFLNFSRIERAAAS